VRQQIHFGNSLNILDDCVISQIIKINPSTIVDFGAGSGKYGKIIRKIYKNKKKEIFAVEGFKPTVDFLKSENIYDSVHHSLIQDWVKNNKKSYDLAIFGDVLEHLQRREIYKVLNSALKHFNNIILTVPLMNIHQGIIGGNKLEIHRSYLYESDFDRYFIREKHVKRKGENYFKMNIWIEKNKLNKGFMINSLRRFRRGLVRSLNYFNARAIFLFNLRKK